METNNKLILTKHKLKHISKLYVDEAMFEQRFSSECAVCNCDGTCCADGVLLDINEKAKILANANIIKKYLEPQQIHDETKWFDNIVEEDSDFPSGKCDGTAVFDGKCVFLCSQGLCALQKASIAEGMDQFALKPFYCVAFPLTIDNSTLTIYEPEFTNRPQCCSSVQSGVLNILDVYTNELKFILGKDGLNEFEELSAKLINNIVNI